MTFTEAAAEVLRIVGKPLHYKDITEIAIQKNLLSHVGKSPEVTMGSRLAALLKKGPKENPLVRIKPGVFALRSWSESGEINGEEQAEVAPAAAESPPANDGDKIEQVAVAEPAKESSDSEPEQPTEVEQPLVTKATDEPQQTLPSSNFPPADEVENNEENQDVTQVSDGTSSETSVEASSDRGASDSQPPSGDSRSGEDEDSDDRADAIPPTVNVDGMKSGAAHGRKYASSEGGRMPEPDELLRADLAARATDVFSEEEDDDKPIFGDDSYNDSLGRRRRRRRRRGRLGEEGLDFQEGLPSYTVSPAFGDAPGDNEVRERRPSRERENPREREHPHARERDRERESPRERDNTRDREANNREPDPRREERATRSIADVMARYGEGEEPTGRDTADMLAHLLSAYERNGGMVALRTLADAAQRKLRLQNDTAATQAQLAAVARADNLRRVAAQQRPRFRVSAGRIGLTDWVLGPELVRLEQEAFVAIERYREAVRRAFATRMAELPGHAIVELCVTLLERLGISQLRAIRRPGTNGGEVHLAGVQRTHASEFRVGVVLRRDGREVGRERVIELRGALHHYGPASAGWIVTTGQVLSGAREEALAPSASPVFVLDGFGLARACDEHDLAVVRTKFSLGLPDLDFFDAMKGSLG
jgi:hypothetical protein